MEELLNKLLGEKVKVNTDQFLRVVGVLWPCLTPREGEILNALFGVNQPKVGAVQLAARWSVGPERIRAIRDRALRRLRQDVVVHQLRIILGLKSESAEELSATGLLMDAHLSRLSIRTQRALRGVGITHAHQLFKLSEADMLNIPGFGRKSLNEVKEWRDG